MTDKVETVARAIAEVISRKTIGEEILANRIKIKDAPAAKAQMVQEMWPELLEEAKAALDAATFEEAEV